jgi:Uma2 family endonuclease
MQPLVMKHHITFDEFLENVREDQKADLIDGVIHMASPESLEGNKLGFWVARLIGDFVEETEQGDVFVSRVAFRLAKDQSPEPDIAFVHKDRLHHSHYGYFEGAPDLAVEVVSPESVERDYEKKRNQYQTAGVREYWIIDEITEQVTLLRLQPSGEFVSVAPNEGRFESIVLPGFYLRPEWLWQTPLPKKAPILARLLNP